MAKDELEVSKLKFYLYSLSVGVMRVSIGFPIEHPIDSIKTQWQAKPYHKNELQIIQHIYYDKGLKGFYAGSVPNYTRCIVRNSYKYPLLIGLPQTFKKTI